MLLLPIVLLATTTPDSHERFTEFYMLGVNGSADTYPSEFVIVNNKITSVGYAGQYNYTDPFGRITLGIVNQEQQTSDYSVSIQIDGSPVDINYAGDNMHQLDGIDIAEGGIWQHEIGFAPQQVGENQKVEFLLYKDGNPNVYRSLYLFINVTGK